MECSVNNLISSVTYCSSDLEHKAVLCVLAAVCQKTWSEGSKQVIWLFIYFSIKAPA